MEKFILKYGQTFTFEQGKNQDYYNTFVTTTTFRNDYFHAQKAVEEEKVDFKLIITIKVASKERSLIKCRRL